MSQKTLNNNVILLMSLIIIYMIGNNIFYLSAYADLPDEINKIQNCKNSKLIDKAIQILIARIRRMITRIILNQ